MSEVQNQFEVGDMVEVVKGEGLGLIEGDVGIVKRVVKGDMLKGGVSGQYIEVSCFKRGLWHSSHFKLLEEYEPESKRKNKPKPKSIRELILPNTQIERDRLAMFHSLKHSVCDAGGNHNMCDDWLNLTVAELIDKLGQNDIRFTYVKNKE